MAALRVKLCQLTDEDVTYPLI